MIHTMMFLLLSFFSFTQLALADVCSNVPLHASAHAELQTKFGAVGSVKITIDSHFLYADISTSGKCKIVDAIFINLLTPKHHFGFIDPHHFPCQQYVSGSHVKVVCPLSKFDIKDCCVDKFLFFLKTIVFCKGDYYKRIAYVGAQTCKSHDICKFLYIPVGIKCPICTSCYKSACRPTDVDDKCQGKSCLDDHTPVALQCKHGKCVKKIFEECDKCQSCSGGHCVVNDKKDFKCSKKVCLDRHTAAKRFCQHGVCLEKKEFCPVCTACYNGDCIPVDKDSKCFGKKCIDDHTPGFKFCKHGKCVLGSAGACDKCEKCTAGHCVKDLFKCKKPHVFKKHCFKDRDCGFGARCDYGFCVPKFH